MYYKKPLEGRIGVISDSHNAYSALEAAIHELKKNRVDHIIHLGGVLDGNTISNEDMNSLDLIREQDVFLVGGTGEDDICWKMREQPEIGSRISPENYKFLAELPYMLRFAKQLRFTHGSVSARKEHKLQVTGTEQIATDFAVADKRLILQQIMVRGYSEIRGVFQYDQERVVNDSQIHESMYSIKNPHLRTMILVPALNNTTDQQFAIIDTHDLTVQYDTVKKIAA